MLSGLSDAMIVRIVIGLAFLVLILYIVVSGKNKEKPGGRDAAVRLDPQALEQVPSDQPLQDADTEILEDFSEQPPLVFEETPVAAQHSHIGVRQTEEYEKIITQHTINLLATLFLSPWRQFFRSSYSWL